MIWQSEVIALLTASLVRPFGLAVAAWLVLFIFRIRHPASRHAVWTAVLVGMLLIPFISVTAPPWKVPILPRSPSSQNNLIERVLPAQTASRVAGPLIALPAQTFSQKLTDQDLITGFYLAGLVAMAAYRIIGWTLLRRLISRSRRLGGPLRESGDIVTPVAVGVLHPAVILPSGWRSWDPATRGAVLAHEFAHIRRKDTVISALARFAKCVFWFHPLAWWVSRKLWNLAELACDAAALEKRNDPAGYARILVEFANLASRAGHRVALPGLAMAAPCGMSQRIDQLFEISGGKLKKLKRPAAVLTVVGVPLVSLAAILGLAESAAFPAEVRLTPARPPLTQVAQAQAPSPAPARAPQPPKQDTAAPVPQNTAQSDVSISLGIVIDNSGSMQDKRAIATAASLALVNSSSPRDEMFVVTFDDAFYLDQAFTNDKQKLEAAIRRSSSRGGSAVRDAISSSIDYSQNSPGGTNALVVITDGDDTSSRLPMTELIDKARGSGIAIYTIGLLGNDEAGKERRAQRTLGALAEGTGGMDFYPRDQAELEFSVAQIDRQIRNRARTPR